METTVLVLDDEPEKRQDLSKYLKKADYIVFTAGTIEEANRIIQIERVDYAIIDLKIDYNSDYGGVKVIENINKIQPRAKTIVLSAYSKTPQIQKQLENVTIYDFVSKGDEENYIRSVLQSIARLRSEAPKKRCFVIMPFSKTKSCKKKEWDDIFDSVIKPAVEDSNKQFTCERANLTIGNIIKNC